MSVSSSLLPSLQRLASRSSGWLIPLTLLLFAFLLRFPAFGDPLIGSDPNWYLYVGGQMLQGYWPYTEIWDRKPIGLFALYAPFNLLGAYRFWAYQIGASVFAFFTAFLIFKIGKKIATAKEGFFVALLYLPALNTFSGFGGREAVFYNLIVTAAFALILFRFDRLQEKSFQLLKTGALAMLLLGIAIQIKPTVCLEGCYLGCVLLFFCWCQKKSLKRLFAYGIIWVLIALFPTLLVIGIYALAGHFGDWYFANIVSIFYQKRPLSYHNLKSTLALFAVAVGIFIFALYNLKKRGNDLQKQMLYFLGGWAFSSATMITLLMGGTRFTLAFVPVLGLIFLLAFYKNPLKNLLFILFLILLTIVGEIALYKALSSQAEKKLYWAREKLVQQNPGCLFQYGGDQIQDLTPFTANCHLTRYLYTDHLGCEEEIGALGIADESEEIIRILNRQPKYISLGYAVAHPADKMLPLLRRQYALINETLRLHYHLAATETPRADGLGLYEKNEISPK